MGSGQWSGVREPLGEILIREGLVARDQLQRGLAHQREVGKRLGETLVELGYVSEEDVAKALALQFAVPYLSLAALSITPVLIRNRPSSKYLREHKVFPIEIKDGALTVAMGDLADPYTLDDLRLSTGLAIIVCLAQDREILDAIDQYYGDGQATIEKIVKGYSEEEGGASGDDREDIDHLRDLASEAPVIQLVNLVITRAVEARASDIHIEPFEDTLRIRYRVDGVLVDHESPPKRLQRAVISRVKIMAKMNIAERRLPQDGRIRLQILGKDLDLRVSTIPTLHGESVVMRILDRSSLLLSLGDMGMPEDIRLQFQRLIRKPHGMILVTGPTGSGKTTTLYTALSEINSADKKIITIEDPVEYQLQGVNQIHVKPKIGLTFANGLRSIVRQDPDIIMVGEIRDAETADIAIHSALTGHLVFSTLHTNDAPGAITRLLDMGIENYLVSSVLVAVLAQRLVRVICHECRESYRLDSAAVRKMGIKTEVDGSMQVFRGKGCAACNFTGYRGRSGIYEFLVISEEIQRLILEKADSNTIRQKALQFGMKTLWEDGWRNVELGVTTLEDLLRVTKEEA
ncbi:type II secretion system protein GspE [Candidatus Methylomirabilis limnetica]|uniref:protein-secreting ATPase n=1 Tax=Candidatus Methylomirabilis limnetica TaxID=2033718 RepID=A0A2T4U1F3_9BACT|nr:type II secretion system ATPase GspE [Candidatus Methylomirabilis limnetica]PTL37185.1 type II secretion system protein GspE [Candidatus Methylomirabilis limnetica]